MTLVAAFMHDCYAYDQIRIAFQAVDSDELIETTEDDVGFQILLQDLDKYLRFGDADWYAKLMAKPFNPEIYILYRRDESGTPPH